MTSPYCAVVYSLLLAGLLLSPSYGQGQRKTQEIKITGIAYAALPIQQQYNGDQTTQCWHSGGWHIGPVSRKGSVTCQTVENPAHSEAHYIPSFIVFGTLADGTTVELSCVATDTPSGKKCKPLSKADSSKDVQFSGCQLNSVLRAMAVADQAIAVQGGNTSRVQAANNVKAGVQGPDICYEDVTERNFVFRFESGPYGNTGVMVIKGQNGKVLYNVDKLWAPGEEIK